MFSLVIRLLALTCPIGSSLALQLADKSEMHDFSAYVTTFGRSYKPGTSEYEERHAVFKYNMQRIRAHNSLPTRTWSAGFSHLSDRTDEELKQLFGYRRSGKKRAGMVMLSEGSQSVLTPPEEVDWTHLTMAGDVPDQGGCGSCWAVATASMLQAHYEIRSNATRTFSVQQLVNCVPNPKECGGSGGCSGATVELAMEYVSKMSLQDVSTEPYLGKDGECSTPVSMTSIMSTGSQKFLSARGGNGADFGLRTWQTLPVNKLLPLMNAVAEGPVAVAVAANAWIIYSSGIFNGCGENGIINHAVVLFGYGYDSSRKTKFWSIRNSWGTSWGENGFIRLLRRDDAEEEAYCGIDVDPAAGIACKPYPETVRICGMCGVLYDSVAASLVSV